VQRIHCLADHAESERPSEGRRRIGPIPQARLIDHPAPVAHLVNPRVSVIGAAQHLPPMLLDHRAVLRWAVVVRFSGAVLILRPSCCPAAAPQRRLLRQWSLMGSALETWVRSRFDLATPLKF